MAMFLSLFVLCAVLGMATFSEKQVTVPLCQNRKIEISIKTLYLISCMLPLFLVCGLRHIGVGPDTDNYVIMFWHPEVLNEMVDGYTKYEPGYVLFVQFLRLFGDHALIYLLGTSAVIFGGMFLFIRNNCKGNYAIALMVFTAFLYYVGFSAIRQAMAVSIAINCVPFLRKKQWVPAALVIALGGMFHMIALLLLVMIPFAITDWDKKKVVIAAVLAIAGILLFEPVLHLAVKIFPIYERYLESEMMQGEGGIGLFAILVTALSVFAAVMLFADWVRFESKEEKSQFIIALIGSIFTIAINLIGRKYGVLSRMTRYFIPFVMILAADVFKCCMPDNYDFLQRCRITIKTDWLMKYRITPKLIFYVGVAGLMGIYFYTIMKVDLYGLIPYKFYWG